MIVTAATDLTGEDQDDMQFPQPEQNNGKTKLSSPLKGDLTSHFFG